MSRSTAQAGDVQYIPSTELGKGTYVGTTNNRLRFEAIKTLGKVEIRFSDILPQNKNQQKALLGDVIALIRESNADYAKDLGGKLSLVYDPKPLNLAPFKPRTLDRPR